MEHSNPLPYITDFLQLKSIYAHTDGGNIATTFDRELIEQIDTIANNTLNEIAWKNVGDYGVLVAERGSTGNGSQTIQNPLLRVMIGGSNYSESTAGQVNTTLALRQPGSTIKPFTYALAFEKLGMTPESTILDLPIAYKTEENYAYEPKNYSQNYKGEITLRQALSESVNIPAIKLAEQVTVPILLGFLR
jgi:penicillin-binding protein 1C